MGHSCPKFHMELPQNSKMGHKQQSHYRYTQLSRFISSIYQKTAVQGSHFDLTSLSEGESIGVAIVPPHGVRFSINGKEIQSPSLTPSPSPQTSTRPGRVFVDLYGPITAVEVLPVQSRESDCCLRLGSLPREVGVAGGIDCRYFELCRRFLHAQRATIAGES